MRRLALVAAYTAIALFRAGPASGADAAAVAKIYGGIVHFNVACGEASPAGRAPVSPFRAD
jgi:hypothetical protein